MLIIVTGIRPVTSLFLIILTTKTMGAGECLPGDGNRMFDRWQSAEDP